MIGKLLIALASKSGPITLAIGHGDGVVRGQLIPDRMSDEFAAEALLSGALQKMIDHVSNVEPPKAGDEPQLPWRTPERPVDPGPDMLTVF